MDRQLLHKLEYVNGRCRSIKSSKVEGDLMG